MANVPVIISRAIITRDGASPILPGASEDPALPVNPDGTGNIPPVDGSYADQATMIADQANQLAQYIYFDGTNYWEYLGTTNGTIVDYRNITSAVVQPNGLVQIGTYSQAGNDITVNPDWIWRFNQVIYQKLTTTLFSITPPATDFTRIDLVYGNTSGQVLIVNGTAVESPDPALAPNLPANSVGFFLIFSNDTGITGFEDFALSSFVRFDVNNQGLSLVERQNARTNIQAVSKDTNDTKTNILNFLNNSLNVAVGINPNADTPLVVSTQGITTTNYNSFLVRRNPATGLGSTAATVVIRGHGTNTRTLTSWLDGSNNPLFSMIANGDSRFFNSAPIHPRSTSVERSVRRDELYLNYQENITDAGVINDLAIGEGTKTIRFTLATNLTGVVPSTTTNCRKIVIYNDNSAGNLTIEHEDAGSTAANRFDIIADFDIPYKTWKAFIYIAGRWRIEA